MPVAVRMSGECHTFLKVDLYLLNCDVGRYLELTENLLTCMYSKERWPHPIAWIPSFTFLLSLPITFVKFGGDHLLLSKPWWKTINGRSKSIRDHYNTTNSNCRFPGESGSEFRIDLGLGKPCHVNRDASWVGKIMMTTIETSPIQVNYTFRVPSRSLLTSRSMR